MSYENGTRYADIMGDVIESGILAKLNDGEGKLLLLLAYYATKDREHTDRYRTAFVFQGKMADKLGCSRRTINRQLKSLTGKGAIRNVGKHYRKGGGQPANVYAVGEYNDLANAAIALTVRPPNAARVAKLNRGQVPKGVRPVSHLLDEKVGQPTDSKVGQPTDTFCEKVGQPTDTEVEVDFELGSRNGNSNFSHQELGITSKSTSTPSADGALVGAVSAKDLFYDLRISVFGRDYYDDPDYRAVLSALNAELRERESFDEKESVTAIWCRRLQDGTYTQYLN